MSVQVLFATLHGDESSPLHCVIPFNHTSYIRYAPRTAHRPFPTVSLKRFVPFVIPTAASAEWRNPPRWIMNLHKIKSATREDSSTRLRSLGMTCRVVVPFNRMGYNCNAPGTAHRPFPTVSLIGVFFCTNVFQKRALPSTITVNRKLSTVN